MRKITNKDAEILQWALRTNAHPVERAPFRPDGEPATLSFVFGDIPRDAAEHLRPIEWTRFFALFHLMGLVLSHDGDRDFDLLKVDDGNGAGPDHLKRMQA